MFEQLTPEARRVIFFARVESDSAGADAITEEHLFLGLIHEDLAFVNRFLQPELTENDLRAKFQIQASYAQDLKRSGEGWPMDSNCASVLSLADEEARIAGSTLTGIEHMLMALLRINGSRVVELFRRYGADFETVKRQLAITPYVPLAKEERLASTGKVWRMAPDSLDATVAVDKKPEVQVEEQTLGALPDTVTVRPFSVNIYSYPVQ